MIICVISSAMKYLHKKNIIHCDLKPDNILINDDFNPFITDFGLSKINELGSLMEHSINFCGTIIYMAPETFKLPFDGSANDIWSCGIILFEMLAGLNPFRDPELDRQNGHCLLNSYKIPKAGNVRSISNVAIRKPKLTTTVSIRTKINKNANKAEPIVRQQKVTKQINNSIAC